MRSLVCAQCHVEYYFKKTEWDDKGEKKMAAVVTLPWEKGLAPDSYSRFEPIEFSISSQPTSAGLFFTRQRINLA